MALDPDGVARPLTVGDAGFGFAGAGRRTAFEAVPSRRLRPMTDRAGDSSSSVATALEPLTRAPRAAGTGRFFASAGATSTAVDSMIGGCTFWTETWLSYDRKTTL